VVAGPGRAVARTARHGRTRPFLGCSKSVLKYTFLCKCLKRAASPFQRPVPFSEARQASIAPSRPAPTGSRA
jgi:hypothetical protein